VAEEVSSALPVVPFPAATLTREAERRSPPRR
jgi:hypothetical protein